MSNTPDMLNWVGGPGRIYYTNDLKNLGYLKHGNLEYSGYLEVFFSPKHNFYLVYVELGLIFRSAEHKHDLSSSSLIDEALIDIRFGNTPARARVISSPYVNIFPARALCKCVYKSTPQTHNLLKEKQYKLPSKNLVK